ncbi:MAG: DNA-protecting protein DprA [Gammaproteobacteria bacterium]|nr:MAG: DNA-protecting protein DprA [Gammaproteobacteria bacterium]
MDAVMSSSKALAWLTLLRAPGLGPRRLLPLLEQVADPEVLLASPPPNTPEKVRQALGEADREQAKRDLEWLTESGNRLLPYTADDYPPLLRELADPPLALFLRGDAALLGLPQIAVVGSRNASRAGLENAHRFARHLADSGLVVTSGLAAGIDSAAHRGALAAGSGTTIAVLGTGLDRVYPARNRELAHQIAEQGLLVSEYPPGTTPLRGNFPRRNRIIAGLSLGTLVVEATLASGSLITARLAGEIGREIFAIPGSIHNPRARGCHALIRQGAKLVETGAHIVEELVSQLGRLLPEEPMTADLDPGVSSAPDLDPDYRELLELMGWEPVSIDWLVTQSRFSAAEISSMLLLLELQGHVSSEPGGLFVRLGKH